MKIAVCVKEVLDARVPVQVSGPAGTIKHGDGAPIRLVNPADRAALEVALKVRAKHPGTTVEVYSVCAPDAQAALVYALACGADKVVRVDPQPDATGPAATALALAGALSGGKFDLICCGDETLDNASAVVGPLLAELLGAAQVTGISEVREVEPGRGVFVRRLDRGHREVVEAGLPLVATFVAEAIQPRYVSQRLLERAAKQPIPTSADRRPGDKGLVWAAKEKTVPARARVKKRFAPEANLSAGDRVKAIMGVSAAPAASSSSASVLEGDTKHLVEQLHRFLKHHEFV